jgi:hypothetical protein
VPRKQRKFITTVEPPDAPPAPGAATLEALVQATLNDFDELAVLPNDVKNKLVGDLVESIKRARARLRFRRRGVSDIYLTKSVFLADLSEALRSAGIAPTRWRKIYDGGERGDESLAFRLARDLSSDAGFELPADLKDLGQSSTRWSRNSV